MTAPSIVPAVLRDEDKFLAERRSGIGGTDSSACIRQHPNRTPLYVIGEKAELLSPGKVTPAMRRGLRLEGLAIAEYVLETGREVRPAPGLVRCPDVPHRIGHFDALVVDEQGRTGVLEVKTTSVLTRAEFQAEPEPRSWMMAYTLQGQWYTQFPGIEFYSIVVWRGLGDDLFHADFEPHAGAIEVLQAGAAKVWGYVEQTRAGEFDPLTLGVTGKDGEFLRRYFPRPEHHEDITLPDDAVEWHRKRMRAYAEIREIEQRNAEQLADLREQEREATNHIQAAIGPYAGGLLPGGKRYSWRANKNGVRSLRLERS